MSTESKQNWDTLMGGASGTAVLRDGREEAVWVRQLAIEDYPRLLAVMEDEQAQLELYCQIANSKSQIANNQAAGAAAWVPVPAGWAKQLSPESHDALMEKAEELNRDFFGRWLQRRLAKMEAIRPGALDAMLTGKSAGQILPSSAPGSRPIAGFPSPKPGGTA